MIVQSGQVKRARTKLKDNVAFIPRFVGTGRYGASSGYKYPIRRKWRAFAHEFTNTIRIPVLCIL